MESLIEKYVNGTKWLDEKYGKIDWFEYRDYEKRFVEVVRKPLWLELDRCGMRHDDFEAWVELETGLETSGVVPMELDLKKVFE